MCCLYVIFMFSAEKELFVTFHLIVTLKAGTIVLLYKSNMQKVVHIVEFGKEYRGEQG